MTRCIAAVLILLISTTSLAAHQHFPKDLLYLKKPIDSLCFFSLENNPSRVNLKNCGLASKKWVIKSQNSWLIANGFRGFDWQDPSATYPAQGFSYYKYFDAGNHQFWIYTINNSGGNGEFTAVSLVKRLPTDTLEIKPIMGGDRCNHGIQEVKEKNHILSLSVNITANDLVSLAHDNPHPIKAYDDLAACAVCCMAKAIYDIGPDLIPKLNYVILDRKQSKLSTLPKQGRFQTCLNKILAGYVSTGETKLDPSKLEAIVKQFNEACVLKITNPTNE